jgi:hypothetical protein
MIGTAYFGYFRIVCLLWVTSFLVFNQNLLSMLLRAVMIRDVSLLADLRREANGK